MKHSRLSVGILLWFLLNIIQAQKSQDPFYIIAHMANNVKLVNWSVSQGANAIENDFQFDDNGQPTVVEHGGDLCDCICAATRSNICRQGLQRKCSGREASNDAAVQLQHIAHLDGIALYMVDSKVEVEWGSRRLANAGRAIVSFLDVNLFEYGYKGNVIIGSATLDTRDYIEAVVTAANHSTNRDRYFFTFDGEDDDYPHVISHLTQLTNRRVYGIGISACVRKTFYTDIQSGVNGKMKGENGLTYIWTIDKESSMRDYINRGVQGIITNRVGVAKRVATSMGLTLAKPSTTIPLSHVMMPVLDKCDCDYHPGGCMISRPASRGYACQCRYKILWTCEGSLVPCDISHPKCFNPDESEEACQLGQGDCDGY